MDLVYTGHIFGMDGVECQSFEVCKSPLLCGTPTPAMVNGPVINILGHTSEPCAFYTPCSSVTDPAVIESAVGIDVQITFAKSKVLRVHGKRGGFYVNVKVQYNSIRGVSQDTYIEVLAIARLWAFGKTMSEGLRCRIVTVVEQALKTLDIKIPASQRLLLVSQVWVDLTTGQGPEDMVNTHLHENRDEYRSKFLGGNLSDSWWSKFIGRVKSVCSFGLLPAPSAGGLPCE